MGAVSYTHLAEGDQHNAQDQQAEHDGRAGLALLEQAVAATHETEGQDERANLVDDLLQHDLRAVDVDGRAQGKGNHRGNHGADDHEAHDARGLGHLPVSYTHLEMRQEGVQGK